MIEILNSTKLVLSQIITHPGLAKGTLSPTHLAAGFRNSVLGFQGLVEGVAEWANRNHKEIFGRHFSFKNTQVCHQG